MKNNQHNPYFQDAPLIANDTVAHLPLFPYFKAKYLKQRVPLGEHPLSVLKQRVPLGERPLAVLKQRFPLGERPLSVLKQRVPLGERPLATLKQRIPLGERSLTNCNGKFAQVFVKIFN